MDHNVHCANGTTLVGSFVQLRKTREAFWDVDEINIF